MSTGLPKSVAERDLQLVPVSADSSKAVAGLPPKPPGNGSKSGAIVEYTKSLLEEEEEDLEIKLRRIIDNVPVRVSNTSGSSAGSGSGDFHQPPEMAQPGNTVMRQFGRPNNLPRRSPITLPALTAELLQEWKALNPFHQAKLIRDSPHGTFDGSNPGDAIDHVNRFLLQVDSIGCSELLMPYVKLCLFPHSLAGEAYMWFYNILAGVITTWEQMTQRFYNKFYPILRTMELSTKILTFKQRDDENICEAWDRYTSMLRQCPHHGNDPTKIAMTFFYGLHRSHQSEVRSSLGGDILNKNGNDFMAEMDTYIDEVRQWEAGDSRSSTHAAKKVQNSDPMIAQMAEGLAHNTTMINALCKRFDSSLNTQQHPPQAKMLTSTSSFPSEEFCSWCQQTDHVYETCPHLEQVRQPEQVNYAGQGGYQPQWVRNQHPNLRYENPNNAANSHQMRPPVPPGYCPRAPHHQQNHAPPFDTKAEMNKMQELIDSLASTQKSNFDQQLQLNQALVSGQKSLEQSVQVIQQQMSQLISNLQQRPAGSFPS